MRLWGKINKFLDDADGGKGEADAEDTHEDKQTHAEEAAEPIPSGAGDNSSGGTTAFVGRGLGLLSSAAAVAGSAAASASSAAAAAGASAGSAALKATTVTADGAKGAMGSIDIGGVTSKIGGVTSKFASLLADNEDNEGNSDVDSDLQGDSSGGKQIATAIAKMEAGDPKCTSPAPDAHDNTSVDKSAGAAEYFDMAADGDDASDEDEASSPSHEPANHVATVACEIADTRQRELPDSVSEGGWCFEEGATSGPSLASSTHDIHTSGRRSPTPSLDAMSITTSGNGTEAYGRGPDTALAPPALSMRAEGMPPSPPQSPYVQRTERISPTPSLDAMSITTSGNGTEAYGRVERAALAPAALSMTSVVPGVVQTPPRSPSRAAISSGDEISSGGSPKATPSVVSTPVNKECTALTVDGASQEDAHHEGCTGAVAASLDVAETRVGCLEKELFALEEVNSDLRVELQKAKSDCTIVPSDARARQSDNEQRLALEVERDVLQARIVEMTSNSELHISGTAKMQADHETQLLATTQQFQRLQSRSDEAESDFGKQGEQLTQAHAAFEEATGKLALQDTKAKEAAKEAEKRFQDCAAQLDTVRATEKSLEQQVTKLQKDLVVAKQRARQDADREKEETLDEVRQEMEKELEGMLKKKDDQVRKLEQQVASGDKAQRDQQKELELLKSELEGEKTELQELQRSGDASSDEGKKKLDDLVAEHQQHLDAMRQDKESEERQKHELALSLRGVEDRARAELAQLEAQKAQLEVHHANVQATLESEQQKVADLSMSLGQASQQLVKLDVGAATGEDVIGIDGRLELAESEAQELRERFRMAEEKLLDAQSTRDMFAKETDMYRSELKVANDERKRAEDELSRAQDRLRELQVSQTHADPTGSQQAVVQSMQKDFEQRTERYRDEVGYLRQKCDEKEKRCEQLNAEKSSLTVELRTLKGGGGGGTDWGSGRDLEGGASTSKGVSGGKPTSSNKSSVRSLPLSAPSWLRNADEPLRMVVRVLAGWPPARIMFFAYIILLHFWVLFILQNAAMQGSTSSSSSPPLPDVTSASSTQQ